MVQSDSVRKGRRPERPVAGGEEHHTTASAGGVLLRKATRDDTETNSSSKKEKTTKKRKRRLQHQALEDEEQPHADATAINSDDGGRGAAVSGVGCIPAVSQALKKARDTKRRKKGGQHQPLTCTTKVAEYGAKVGPSGVNSTSKTETAARATKKKAKKHKREKKNDRRASLCQEKHVPSTVGSVDNTISNTNSDDDNDESAILEGVVHDGTMYLVDARRRVFSAQRDEGGNLVEVGTFDDKCDRVTMTGQPPLGSFAEGKLPLAAAEAEASSSSSTRDPATPGSKKKKKRKKKGKNGAAVDEGNGATTMETEAGTIVEYPFEVEECDHCETSERAYSDITPLLSALAAELGKPPQDLVIYDPYYCQGSTVGRLASLGFPRVHNRKEDFYEVIKNGKIPEHDVVVTNPPFSGEHVPKILNFCSRPGAKPWFLLLPNYVYLKDYYEPSLGGGSARGASLPFYLTPPKRYMYYSPQGSRLKVKSSERKTSPFNTFWYIRLGDGADTSKILQSYDAVSRKTGVDARCCIARTTQQIPYKMMDSNDHRRKKARDRQRSIDRIRKKKSEWIVG